MTYLIQVIIVIVGSFIAHWLYEEYYVFKTQETFEEYMKQMCRPMDDEELEKYKEARVKWAEKIVKEKDDEKQDTN